MGETTRASPSSYKFQVIQEFFLNKMKQHKYLSRRRYLWGNLYSLFGNFFGVWEGKHILMYLFGLIITLVCFGYIATDAFGMIDILFIMPILAALIREMLPNQKILIPAGRADKFWGVLLLSCIHTLFSLLFLSLAIMISSYLQPVLPDLVIKKIPLSYHAMNINLFPIFIIGLPLAFSMNLWCARRGMLKFVIFMLSIHVLIFLSIAYFHNKIGTISLMAIAGITILAWGIFFAVLYYVTMRRSLVGQD